MRHNTIDEFSVTDFRHTLNEGWRVICARRWYILFPLCLVSSMAFFFSLWVPRTYTASTVIKRELDPVFANMVQKSWTQPYEDIRKRMGSEIAKKSFITTILDDEDLPENLPHFTDGSLTPEGLAARQALVREVSSGLTTSILEASKHRDVIKISLTLKDPSLVERILPLVRDRYMALAHDQTIKTLKNVEVFLKSESGRSREALARLQRRLTAYELKYPGINPQGPNPHNVEQTALVRERVNIKRKTEELELQREALRTELARLKGSGDEAMSDTGQMMVETPNPRYAELVNEIQRLERKIIEDKTDRSMTDEHPTIKRTRTLLAARRVALAQMPSVLRVSAKVAGQHAAVLSKIARIRKKLADIDSQKAGMTKRLAGIEKQLSELDGLWTLVTEHRQDYLTWKGQADQLSNKLDVWRQNIAPIQNVLYLEDKDRGLHFTTVQAVSKIGKPTSPDSSLVVIICLGAGLAASVIAVLLAELFDRSYRTVKQLTASLSLPVIESIDEIMTKAIQRRRMIRKMVMMPALAIVMMAATALAGTIAYRSLNRPRETQSMFSIPKWMVVSIGESD